MDKYEVYKRLLKKPSNLICRPIINGILFLQEDFENNLDEDTSEVNNYNRKNNLPSKVLIELINDKSKYKVIEKFLSQNKNEYLHLFAIDKQGACETKAFFTKKNLVETLLEFIAQDSNNDSLTDEKLIQYQNLRKMISYENFLKQEGNDQIEYESFRGEYKIKKSALMRILSLPSKTLLDILENDNIAGIPKPEFLKCTHKALTDRHIKQNYSIPQKIHDNHILLINNIDAAITEFPKPERMPYEKDIEVNAMLWEEIWSKVPENFNKLEKAYYIYHELCKILSYDEEAFINGLDPKTLDTHNIHQLKYINKQSAEVLCFEFAAIYSKFLEELDIPYNIYGNEKFNRQDHSRIEFAYEEFYVIADSTRSLFEGDLVKAKNGQKDYTLSDFSLSTAHSERTKKKFEEQLANVKEYIKNEDQDKNYDNLIAEYYTMTKKEDPLSPEERLNLFLNFVSEIDLKPTDAMGYINNLKKILFCSSYEENCDLVFIKDNNPPASREKTSALAAVICYNPEDVNGDFIYDNQYFLYIPEVGVSPIKKEELEYKLLTEELAFIKQNGYVAKKIPGINTEGGANARKNTNTSQK